MRRGPARGTAALGSLQVIDEIKNHCTYLYITDSRQRRFVYKGKALNFFFPNRHTE
jgi:hypothetical protein